MSCRFTSMLLLLCVNSLSFRPSGMPVLTLSVIHKCARHTLVPVLLWQHAVMVQSLSSEIRQCGLCFIYCIMDFKQWFLVFRR